MAAQKIEITIDGNNITAIKAIDGVETKLKGLGGKAKSAVSGLGNMADVLGLNALNVSVGAAAAGIGVMIKNTIDLADNLNDMSKRSGVSVEQLSTLKYAAENSGSSLDGLGTSLKFLNKNIFEASTGNKELGSAFSSLGITVKDAEGKLIQGDQALYQIADRFKSMPDGPEKAALALQIFGRSGTEMIPMLNEGSEGILKMQQEAQNLGMQISTKTAQQMDEFNDKLARVKGSAQGAAVSIVDAFGPAVTSILTNFAEGLDVIFGKAELIEGIQFKELLMSIAQVNEFTKSLVKTSKEWREEQIKIIQHQFAIAKGEELTAELKLHQLNTQLGILTLLTDEDNIQAEKLRTAKAQVSALAQQLELIKKIIEESKPKGGGSNNNNPEKDKKEKKEAEERHRNFMKNLSYIEENSTTKGGRFFEVPDNLKPKLEFLPSIDTSGMQENIDAIKSKTTEVSTAAQADFYLMQLAGTDTFGAIGNSLMEFATLNGKTNKEMFAAAKAFSIAQAIMNTYEGASKAIAQGGIFGGIMAAGVIAMGLANVARIASTQPGSTSGGGGGSSYSPSSSITNGSGAQAYANSITNNNSQKQFNVTLVVNGDVVDPDQWFRKNKASIQKLFDDGIVNFGSN